MSSRPLPPPSLPPPPFGDKNRKISKEREREENRELPLKNGRSSALFLDLLLRERRSSNICSLFWDSEYLESVSFFISCMY